MGGMIEADVYCLAGLLYSAFVCLSSMSLFWWLELSPGWEWLGDAVAILWIGVSMSFVAWTKVWMVGILILFYFLPSYIFPQASPSFNTGGSLGASTSSHV